tara:strand:- start:375 stop:587 length:213 start_codon:yes stop_codon:yes gene_type:complete
LHAQRQPARKAAPRPAPKLVARPAAKSAPKSGGMRRNASEGREMAMLGQGRGSGGCASYRKAERMAEMCL